MSFVRFASAALTAVTVMAGTAHADTITIGDHVASGLVNSACTGNCTPATWYMPVGGYQETMVNVAPAGSNMPAWALGKTANFGDVIGGPEFDIKGLVIQRNTANVVFTIHENYSGLDSYGTKYADIFIDTGTPNTPNSWNYAIELGGTGPLLTNGIANDWTRSGVTAGLYSVNAAKYKTSDQVWAGQPGYGIGGLISFCSNDTNPNNGDCNVDAAGGVAIAPATLVNSSTINTAWAAQGGDKVGTVTVARNPDGSGGYYLVVTVTPTNMSIFTNSFDVLASSADCANDALWGTVSAETNVPVPGALALLGFGLAGLAGIRRKRAN